MTTTDTQLQPESQPWVPELTFAARLALVRHKMGWNVKEAATACGFAAQSWRGWELQGREPHRLTTIAMTIATRTGVDYLWLVHGPDRGGQTIRRSAYVGTRVLSTIGQPTRHASTHPQVPLPPTRSVRQTRPLVGGFNRPHTPVAV
jgi:hypothetical protein